jgi:hypothetical protein
MFEKTPLAEVIKNIEKNKKVIIEFNINHMIVLRDGKLSRPSFPKQFWRARDKERLFFKYTSARCLIHCFL